MSAISGCTSCNAIFGSDCQRAISGCGGEQPRLLIPEIVPALRNLCSNTQHVSAKHYQGCDVLPENACIIRYSRKSILGNTIDSQGDGMGGFTRILGKNINPILIDPAGRI